MRILKDPEVRRAEIMDAAEGLFHTKGYNDTTIMDILSATGIAKGTFYYYFKSKEEILDAVIERVVDADMTEAQKIADNPDIPVFDKLFQALLGQRPKADGNKAQIMGQIHQPNNAEMHQKSLVRAITRMTPVLTQIIEQGIQEGVMKVEYPQETMAFLLAAGQTVFDKALFQREAGEVTRWAEAFIQLMEAALGAAKGSFDDMMGILVREDNW